MRKRMLVPITGAVLLSGCTDAAPTGPRPQLGGRAHFGAYPGANGKIAFSSSRGPEAGIFTMNVDGSDVQLLVPGGFGPAWSPNGTRIAFNRWDGSDHEIFVMNADGTGLIQLSSNNANDNAPTWSPDGATIAYSSDVTGVAQIYKVSANGGGTAIQLTNSTAANGSPAWSPDGSKIAFTSFRDGQQEIYVMFADGSSQTRLTLDTEWDYDPTWSPDGTKIAYTHGGVGANIFTMNADGSSPTNLTKSTLAGHATSAWSPDGSRIAFQGVIGDNSEIFVMNADGTGILTNISNNAASDVVPDWQPLPTGPNVSEQVQLLITHLTQANLPKGTTNGLKAVLNDVLAALNANNTPQACSSLADFISRVRAQSGKKIPADVATALIQEAEAIAAALGCVAGSKCYPELPAPQLVLQSTTVQNGSVVFQLDVPNYASFPNELFLQAPDLPACGLNTSASRTWVDIVDGNGNFLYGFCSLGQASDLNSLFFQTTVAAWPAEAQIKVIDRRCNITYTSNKINLASIF